MGLVTFQQCDDAYEELLRVSNIWRLCHAGKF